MQGTSAKYIMCQLRVTAAVDEVSGRSVEYRQLCFSVWVEKDILIKMVELQDEPCLSSRFLPDVDCVCWCLHIS